LESRGLNQLEGLHKNVSEIKFNQGFRCMRILGRAILLNLLAERALESLPLELYLSLDQVVRLCE
jgi:hypothetical protein